MFLSQKDGKARSFPHIGWKRGLCRGISGVGKWLNAEKCLIFHKHKNRRMHTTNNVPQSRCRVFLIYVEPSEMGRWSERRWRHAVGLHFSLFSPHKQAMVPACSRHTPTHCSMTQTDTRMRGRTTPTPHVCLLPPVLMPHTVTSTFFQRSPTLSRDPQLSHRNAACKQIRGV